MRCQHKGMTIIERVIVENFVTFSDGKPPEDSDDWTGNPVRWYNPQPMVMIVNCSDCGFERFYGPRAKRPKWVQAAWDALIKVQVRD